jgi:hypothetical protein
MEKQSKPRGNPQVSCRVPPEWIQEMERRAQGRSVAAVMREALAVYLNKEVSNSEMEKKYLALEKRLAYLESKVIEKS